MVSLSSMNYANKHIYWRCSEDLVSIYVHDITVALVILPYVPHGTYATEIHQMVHLDLYMLSKWLHEICFKL